MLNITDITVRLGGRVPVPMLGLGWRAAGLSAGLVGSELAPGTVVTVHRGAIGKIVNDVPAGAEEPSYDDAPYEERADDPQATEPTAVEPGETPTDESKPREAN